MIKVIVGVLTLCSIPVGMLIVGSLAERFPNAFERLLGWVYPVDEGDRHG